jgi:hypothetical protein
VSKVAVAVVVDRTKDEEEAVVVDGLVIATGKVDVVVDVMEIEKVAEVDAMETVITTPKAADAMAIATVTPKAVVVDVMVTATVDVAVVAEEAEVHGARVVLLVVVVVEDEVGVQVQHLTRWIPMPFRHCRRYVIAGIWHRQCRYSTRGFV